MAKGQFFICALQAKSGIVSLRIKKKGSRIIDQNKINGLRMTVYNCVNSCYSFYCQIDHLLKEKYFVDFRLIKTNAGHHFHFICICKDKYVNRIWESVLERQLKGYIIKKFVLFVQTLTWIC